MFISTEDQQALEEEGLMMPSKAMVSTFRNPHQMAAMQNFSNMNAPPYQNVFHAAINPSIQMYPSLESHHLGRPEMPNRSISVEREHMEMTTFPVSGFEGDSMRKRGSSTTFSEHFQPVVYQAKLSKLNVGGVVDILHQVDELRPSLDQIIPKLKENGISGKVLRHCDLKELKNVGVFVGL